MANNRHYLPDPYGIRVQPTVGWTVLWGPTDTADGEAILDPYDLELFQRGSTQELALEDEETIPYSKDIKDGGRLFTLAATGETLELLPLFTVDGASATLQMFGFDWIQTKAGLDTGNPNYTKPTSNDNSWALGLAVNLFRNLEGNPATYTLPAIDGGETQLITVSDNVPIPDAFGAAYTMGIRYRLSRDGFSAVFPWVTNITAGEFMLLGRVI